MFGTELQYSDATSDVLNFSWPFVPLKQSHMSILQDKWISFAACTKVQRQRLCLGDVMHDVDGKFVSQVDQAVTTAHMPPLPVTTDRTKRNVGRKQQLIFSCAVIFLGSHFVCLGGATQWRAKHKVTGLDIFTVSEEGSMIAVFSKCSTRAQF